MSPLEALRDALATPAARNLTRAAQILREWPDEPSLWSQAYPLARRAVVHDWPDEFLVPADPDALVHMLSSADFRQRELILANDADLSAGSVAGESVPLEIMEECASVLREPYLLKRLDLSDWDDPAMVARVVIAFAPRHLVVRRVPLRGEHLAKLLSVLDPPGLDVSGLPLGERDAECILRGEREDDGFARGAGGVSSLRAAATSLDAARVRVLLATERARALTALDLADNPLGEAGARVLADADLASLRSLDLAGTGLTARALDALLAAPWAAGLHTLRLDDNPLGAAFAAGRLASLRALSVRHAGLDDDAAAGVVSALPTGIESLRLGSVPQRRRRDPTSGATLPANRAGDGAARALASAGLTALRELEIAFGAVTDAGLGALLAPGALPALAHLDLRGNALSREGRAALVANERLDADTRSWAQGEGS